MSPPARTVELPERFELRGHVARGGMASVWAAEDRTLGRTVAIKLLASRFLGDDEAVRRFEREARAAASLSSHPNVVTIFDVGEHRGQPFIVMEYMSGGSVAEILRGGVRPAPAEALRWLAEAAAALDAAHERGIVHRDVKPGNLLLDERRRLAVTDFGIARVAFDTTVTSTGQVMGTAAYLSPEQAAGESASAASDRYALAVVAYELLAGRRPFEGRNFAMQARQHVEEKPPPPSARASGELTDAVDPVLLRGLAKDPEARWPTATEMVDGLEQALGAAAAPAVAPPEPTEVTRELPRRRAPRPEPLTPRPRREPVLPPGRERPTPRPARAAAGWVLGLAALALAAIAVLAGVLAGGGGGSGDRAASPRATTPTRPTTTTQPRGASATTPVPSPASTSPPSSTSATVAAADGRSPSQLQAAGHQKLSAGRAADAIPDLQAAVDKCGASTVVDPCAYALYDLGHALRLAGRPADAIPVLERRLQIPNQQDTVRQELDLAKRQAGQGSG